MLHTLAPDLWLLSYELPKLGADLRRNVTVIRLHSGDVVVHSTGPFPPEDVGAIKALGRPAFLVEAMLHHDTFAKEGRAAFPEAAYLAPAGFSELAGVPTGPLLPAPPEWDADLFGMEIDGMPGYREHVFLHQPSRTLIVADLVFNFGPDEPIWTELLLKIAISGNHHPGVARPFKAGIEDRPAFDRSIEAMFRWDFERVVVGHGDVIETGGKEKVRSALQAAGLLS